MPTTQESRAIRSGEHFQAMVRRIYEQMPDARLPRRDDEGFYMWGDVAGTQQWAFCEQIAFEIICAAQAYSR